MTRVLAAMAFLLPVAAQGQRLSSAARAKMDEGIRLHEAGDYGGAVDVFRVGYSVQAHPDFLYAIGQSERKRGDCRAAVEAYKAFLDTHPPAAEARRAEANRRRCEEKLAAESPPPAEPTREAPAMKEPPGPPEPKAAPSPAAFEPAPDVRPDDPSPRARPLARTAAGGPAREDDGEHLDWAATVLYASGGAAIALGSTLLLMANGRASQANAASTLDEFDDQGAATSRLRIMGGASMVVGVALVGGGVVRSVLRWRRQSVSAQLTPGGGAIVWGGEF